MTSFRKIICGISLALSGGAVLLVFRLLWIWVRGGRFLLVCQGGSHVGFGFGFILVGDFYVKVEIGLIFGEKIGRKEKKRNLSHFKILSDDNLL